MLKIILDCDLMRFKDSGLYHYCLNLGSYVRQALEREQFDNIAFYVPSSARMAFSNSGCRIVERSWHKRLVRPFLLDCNIWHAPFQSGRILKGLNKHTKVLLTIHDLNCIHENKSDKERDDSLRHTQNLVNRSDAIVCISNHSKKDVLAHLDVKNKPVHVIYNGTHRVPVPPENPEGIRPSRPFIFTMGYVNRKKNFHTLVPLLENTNVDLVVAGKLDEIDYVKKMQQLALNLGVADRLHILGPVTEQDKAWYFNNCKAFMLPSLAEGFGAPVVEAMRFGKPIFLSDLTSLPEIGGNAAFYFRHFEPEHMRKVFNEGLAQFQINGMATKIIERGNQFLWEEKAKEYIELYRTML